ncbi:diacylglycerol kinase epsilon-like [Tigriopus californicus]|uniref:diacylglycerol kinase epsilon-like n=1 Tax=Tigriopus californicus TaxID=6832 RepID=UPI0027DA2093|nr:diacylglycerol kinase epsilon-like [Tigriopus californicus]
MADSRDGSFPDSVTWGITCLLVLLTWVLLQKLCFPRSPLAALALMRRTRRIHTWAQGGIWHPLYCVICETLLIVGSSGICCADCGIASCEKGQCVQRTEQRFSCKARARKTGATPTAQDDPQGGVFRHHWVSGNLPLMSECEVCDASCGGDGPESVIQDLRCCWCQLTVHKSCQQKMSNICDLGHYREFIIPPECVILKNPKVAGSEFKRSSIKQIVRQIMGNTTHNRPWRPLIVVGNTKAGNNDGGFFLNAFRGVLNPIQVIDLNERPMEDAIHLCQLLEPTRCLIIVAGGDGTIGWTLNTIDKLGVEQHPEIALLPLGTGNDLARTLGYGSGGEITDISQLLDLLQTANRLESIPLDRWRVTVRSDHPHYSFKRPLVPPRSITEIFVQNYLSIGVDALVTYNFHNARDSKSSSSHNNSPFSGRLYNKLLYFIYGTKDVLERECKDLDQILELEMDGQKVSLPKIESVVILNIPCWGAGVRPWELGQGHEHFPVPSFSDHKLEVFCVYSSFHIAQMQVGISEPHRIGQASDVKIRLKGRAPVQTDGEPWIQEPGEIHVQYHSHVPVLKLSSLSN